MARRASEQRYCSSCMRVTNWIYLSNYSVWQCGRCGTIFAESGPGRARSSDIPEAFRRMDIPQPRQPPPPTYRKAGGKSVLTWAILIFCLLIVGGIVTYILFSEEIKELVNGYAAGSGGEPIPAIAAPTPVTTPTVPSTPRRSIPTPTTLPLFPGGISAPTRTPAEVIEVVMPATATLGPTPTLFPTRTPRPTLTPTPNFETVMAEAKVYMLNLINADRTRAGVGEVELGDNVAAQLHAESSLRDCYSSHWGIDGLKPYMRYTLAGGQQYDAENTSGLDYCVKAGDGYSRRGSLESELREAMDGLMDSPGHRDNILDSHHRKVNLGLSWDNYNMIVVQHFEGAYVDYENVPIIEGGLLSLSGSLKDGATFRNERGLGLQIYYDPAPHSLTRGQVSRTYCYDGGLQIGSLRPPLTGNSYYLESHYSTTQEFCPDPYDVPSDAQGARSATEALTLWQQSYDASQRLPLVVRNLPWITASHWDVEETAFSVEADINELLEEHGDGVYTILLWASIGQERTPASSYSIFYGIEPPSTYAKTQVKDSTTTN